MFGTFTVTHVRRKCASGVEKAEETTDRWQLQLSFGLSVLITDLSQILSLQQQSALIVVGFLMISSILKIDFNDYTESIPAYIGIIAMPFMYSISEGIFRIIPIVINLVWVRQTKRRSSTALYSGSTFCKHAVSALLAYSSLKKKSRFGATCH